MDNRFYSNRRYRSLTKFCTKRKIALIISEPSEEDEVPTKLKNNKVVSLIYPVTDFGNRSWLPRIRHIRLVFAFLLDFLWYDFWRRRLRHIARTHWFGTYSSFEDKGQKNRTHDNIGCSPWAFNGGLGTLTCTWFDLKFHKYRLGL